MALLQLPALDSAMLHLQGREIEGVLAEMFNAAAKTDGMTDRDRAWSDLLARHAAGPLALSADIALPHARTAAVKRIIFLAGRCEMGVAFDPQHPAVKLVFMVLTPKEQPSEYLQLVAALTARLRDPSVRERLLKAKDSDEFESVLSN
jgi:mannitol/fructose-specific phosphotransferase system IIA component (Ntr-type)